VNRPGTGHDGDHIKVASLVLPGRPEQVAGARRRVAALAAAWGAAADVASLVAGELIANAIVHTRSGQAGGTVAVAVVLARDGVTVHVHDQGIDRGQVPAPRPPADDGDGLAENGRGLPIVIAVSTGCGTCPAVRCPVSVTTDPAASAGGCCTWCRLPAQPDRSGPPAPRPTLAAGTDNAGPGGKGVLWTAQQHGPTSPATARSPARPGHPAC
jgi:anti-sigma regulatory factor (Ser/Thr protein kinase)